MKSDYYIDPVTATAKRISDLVLASTGLLLTLPLFLPIAVSIKLSSPGPVFFKQLRIGKATPDHVAVFEILKFRTMVQDAEQKTGAAWAQKCDPRVTAVGSFLRKSHLDELPQFLNVLKGDMSIIGPRPERPDFHRDLESNIPFFVERTFGVAPGITGLAQVNQDYGACIEDARVKVGFDHSYALALGDFVTWIRTDIGIALRTIVLIVTGRGR